MKLATILILGATLSASTAVSAQKNVYEYDENWQIYAVRSGYEFYFKKGSLQIETASDGSDTASIVTKTLVVKDKTIELNKEFVKVNDCVRATSPRF